MTGTTGKTENLYSYDGFGNILESREEIQNRILYTGQQYDQETGQYYLRVRYYNPVIGRFTQEDTYRGDGLNLYAYCGNNPVMYYDPSGHLDENCNNVNDSESNNLEDTGVSKLKENPTEVVIDTDTGVETYYRTMSEEQYDILRMTGEVQPTGETFISPTQSFSDNYDGVMVEIHVKSGTTNQLEAIGIKNNSNLTNNKYPDMPNVEKGWTTNSAQFKGEGNQINIGLSKGKGLEIFNSNIIDFQKVGG